MVEWAGFVELSNECNLATFVQKIAAQPAKAPKEWTKEELAVLVKAASKVREGVGRVWGEGMRRLTDRLRFGHNCRCTRQGHRATATGRLPSMCTSTATPSGRAAPR